MNNLHNIVLRFGQYKVSLSNEGGKGRDLRSVTVLKSDQPLPPRLWLPHGDEFDDNDIAIWISSSKLIEVLQTVKRFDELDRV